MGFFSSLFARCGQCGDTGWVTKKCRKCKGTGEWRGHICPRCDGEGTYQVSCDCQERGTSNTDYSNDGGMFT